MGFKSCKRLYFLNAREKFVSEKVRNSLLNLGYEKSFLRRYLETFRIILWRFNKNILIKNWNGFDLVKNLVKEKKLPISIYFGARSNFIWIYQNLLKIRIVTRCKWLYYLENIFWLLRKSIENHRLTKPSVFCRFLYVD